MKDKIMKDQVIKDKVMVVVIKHYLRNRVMMKPGTKLLVAEQKCQWLENQGVVERVIKRVKNKIITKENTDEVRIGYRWGERLN